MARVKIQNLNRNVRITTAEMRRVAGGGLVDSPMGVILRPGPFAMLFGEDPDPIPDPDPDRFGMVHFGPQG